MRNSDSTKPERGRLQGKVAIVTGAASNPGMGWSIAHLFALEGADVVCTDVDNEGVEICAASIREMGGSAMALRHDVTSQSDWTAVVEAAVNRFGSLKVLVNNAGVTTHKLLDDLTLEDFRRISGVNLEGPFLGMKAAVPHMRRTGGGSIVNIVSIAGRIGASKGIAYGASKGGLWAMSKAVAMECAPDGIRCNTVHPGVIWTNMNMHSAQSTDRDSVRWGDYVPLGRMGDGDDIAGATLYLASDDARYVTGAEIYVDGGLTSALPFKSGAND